MKTTKILVVASTSASSILVSGFTHYRSHNFGHILQGQEPIKTTRTGVLNINHVDRQHSSSHNIVSLHLWKRNKSTRSRWETLFSSNTDNNSIKPNEEADMKNDEDGSEKEGVGENKAHLNGILDLEMDLDTMKTNGVSNGATNATTIEVNGVNGLNGEQQIDLSALSDSINDELETEAETNGADITKKEVKLTDLQTKKLASKLPPLSEGSRKMFDDIAGPIFGQEIEKGVSKDTIKGAFFAGVALTMITNNFNPNISATVAIWTAYLAITPGKSGNIARAIGETAWDSTKTVMKSAKKLAKAIGIRIPFMRPDPPINGELLLSGQEEIELDSEIANLVQEVEETVAEVESVVSESNAARDAAAEEERLMQEADRLTEDARRLEIEYLLEEAQIEKEAFRAEEEFRAVEAQIAEEERLEREAEEALLAEEERVLQEEARIAEGEEVRLKEEQRLAEEAKIAEEKRIAEEARLVQEQKIAEEARLAEEQKIAEEAKIAEDSQSDEDDDDDEEYIDELEWEASIQLADDLEYSDDQDGEYKNDWNAARQLANDLTDDADDDSVDYDAPGLSDDERMELIAKAARLAVEKFEDDKQEEQNIVEQEKEKRNEMKLELLEADILKNPIDIEELNGTKDLENNGIEPSKEYEKMTVKELKDILRNQGLKVSGRKAELIERLRSQ